MRLFGKVFRPLRVFGAVADAIRALTKKRDDSQELDRLVDWLQEMAATHAYSEFGHLRHSALLRSVLADVGVHELRKLEREVAGMSTNDGARHAAEKLRKWLERELTSHIL